MVCWYGLANLDFFLISIELKQQQQQNQQQQHDLPQKAAQSSASGLPNSVRFHSENPVGNSALKHNTGEGQEVEDASNDTSDDERNIDTPEEREGDAAAFNDKQPLEREASNHDDRGADDDAKNTLENEIQNLLQAAASLPGLKLSPSRRGRDGVGEDEGGRGKGRGRERGRGDDTLKVEKKENKKPEEDDGEKDIFRKQRDLMRAKYPSSDEEE